jgi:hypothetical protein
MAAATTMALWLYWVGCFIGAPIVLLLTLLFIVVVVGHRCHNQVKVGAHQQMALSWRFFIPIARQEAVESESCRKWCKFWAISSSSEDCRYIKWSFTPSM